MIRFATAGDVAAFIAEPVMGEGGIIVPPKNYFREVKKVLDQHGILFIADEVQSGFGRTGKMFAIEHYGVVPDILVTAKGIADGFPLSAFTTRPEIAAAYNPATISRHSAAIPFPALPHSPTFSSWKMKTCQPAPPKPANMQ